MKCQIGFIITGPFSCCSCMQGKQINAVNMGNVWKLLIANSALNYILQRLTETMYFARILVELLLTSVLTTVSPNTIHSMFWHCPMTITVITISGLKIQYVFSCNSNGLFWLWSQENKLQVQSTGQFVWFQLEILVSIRNWGTKRVWLWAVITQKTDRRG